MRSVYGMLRFLSVAALFSMLITLITLPTDALSGAPSLQPSAALADDARAQQWQIDSLQASKAWEHTRGDDVVVAVLDSGVDAQHEDLTGRVLAGADYVDGSTSGRDDPVGHGTAVAGLIAGRDDDTNGVLGLAPEAKILPVRVLDKNNEYDSAASVADAVRWATDHGADVINLSLGSANTSETLAEAVRYALKKDVVVVACNGNYSNERGTEVWHPAREPGVIAVSGVGRNSEFWDGSLYGEATVLAAPAANLTIATPGGGTRRGAYGTSYAAPLVSAAAALVRSAYPSMSAANIVNRLISTAWDFGTPGVDDQFGYGIVNPTEAISQRLERVDRNPLLPPDATLDRTPPSTHSTQENTSGGYNSGYAPQGDSNGAVVIWIIGGALTVGILVVLFWIRRRGRISLFGFRYGYYTEPPPPTPPLAPPSGVPPSSTPSEGDDQATVLLPQDDQATLRL